MFTRENYINYILEGYKGLDEIIRTKSLAEVIAALPANVSVIMAKEHLITPLLIAILHDREDVIRYLIKHDSLYLGFFHKDCNPFVYLLNRCLKDNDNVEYLKTLFLMIIKKPNLDDEMVSQLLESRAYDALKNLVILVREYQKQEGVVRARIIYQDRIAKHYKTYFEGFKAEVYWKNQRDGALLDLCQDFSWNIFFEFMASDTDFFEVANRCIKRIGEKNSLTNSQALCLAKANLDLGRIHLSRQGKKTIALNYFLAAQGIANKYKLTFPVAITNFINALSIIYKNYLGKISSSPTVDEELKFFLALREPALNGSKEALAYLEEAANSPNKLRRNVLIAYYIYHSENFDRSPHADNQVYKGLIEGYAFQYGIGKVADFESAYNSFIYVANTNRDVNNVVSFFACLQALALLRPQIIALNTSINENAVKNGATDAELENFYKLKARKSSLINKVATVFHLMLSVMTEIKDIDDIKEHFNRIFDFAHLVEEYSGRKYSDQLLMFKAVIAFFKAIKYLFTDQIAEVSNLIEMLDQIDSNIKEYHFLNKINDWDLWIQVLCEIGSKCTNTVLRVKIFEKLFNLQEHAKDEIKNKKLQLSIMQQIADAYFDNITHLTVNELAYLTRDKEGHLVEMIDLEAELKMGIDTEKYHQFYLELAKKDEHADNPYLANLYFNSFKLGNIESAFNLYDTFDNSETGYNSKIQVLTGILLLVHYPENKNIVNKLYKKLSELIKLKYTSRNLPKELGDFHAQALCAKKCANNDGLFGNSELLKIFHNNYFPALIKLTLRYMQSQYHVDGLYCSARLMAELIFNEDNHKKDYGLEDHIAELKSNIFEYVREFISKKSEKMDLANWILGFIYFITKLEEYRKKILLDQGILLPIHIEALIFVNAQSSGILKVAEDIKTATNNFTIDWFKDLNKLHNEFFLLRRHWGDRVVYISDEDQQTINNRYDQAEVDTGATQLVEKRRIHLFPDISTYNHSDLFFATKPVVIYGNPDEIKMLENEENKEIKTNSI